MEWLQPSRWFCVLIFVTPSVCHADNPPRLNSLPKVRALFFLPSLNMLILKKCSCVTLELISLSLQETVQESAKVSESSLVYSVLDFPMRSSAVLEVNPSDTEYAAVSYLPEMRPVWLSRHIKQFFVSVYLTVSSPQSIAQYNPKNKCRELNKNVSL